MKDHRCNEIVWNPIPTEAVGLNFGGGIYSQWWCREHKVGWDVKPWESTRRGDEPRVCPVGVKVNELLNTREVLNDTLEKRKLDECPVHGTAHGAEAEELRRAIEAIISKDYSVEPCELQDMLDNIDARDSLSALETIDDLRNDLEKFRKIANRVPILCRVVTCSDCGFTKKNIECGRCKAKGL